ncbi:unnamed protein product [Phyllotreta striolata]|uniref:Cupin-like domain-containing protein n=1 Tax=Phyllotreta striolata TaxID=444603 RepID=A0A9N9XKM7_PHYSR|nr:unnamed protein product [Phyllotreta striolata]
MSTPNSKRNDVSKLKKSFCNLNKVYMSLGCSLNELEHSTFGLSLYKIISVLSFAIILTSVLLEQGYITFLINYIFGVRCIVPNNYFIWEATRPISDCNFCVNVSKPVVLPNSTRELFSPYSYGSQPIVIKGAFLHWPAMRIFSLEYFQDLYNRTDGSIRSVDEECQFLHFKSDFISLKDVLSMSKERSLNDPKEKSWYVGWGNCHPTVLEEMRNHYPKPHFLPEDSEIPSKEYIFMGYDDGATLHLDFINRLMWQAQLKGTKHWYLHPPPECEHVCKSLEFSVEPGDAGECILLPEYSILIIPLFNFNWLISVGRYESVVSRDNH